MAKALLLAAVLALPSFAHASDAVQIRVTVVHATQSPAAGVDPRLADLRDRLKPFAFNSFRQLDDRQFTLSFKSPAQMPVPGGRELTITPKQIDKSGKIRVRLQLSQLLDTTYSIERGGTI